jgi:BlaR1 peptidase M56
MFGVYALSWVRLRRFLRKCPREIIDGHEVWVTPDQGPAVMGCIAPRVLLPRWALELPEAARQLILAHEVEHIASRDACLLLAGVLMVGVAPWNPFLWWQLRRLRLAIEVDCDARLLANNANVRDYGEVLLLASRKALAHPGFALTEATSDLEHRIRVMTRPRAQHRWAALTASIMLSFGCLAAAIELNAPPIHRPSVLRKLPPEYHSPYLHSAEVAARTAFPDLFQGRFSGSVEIQVGLNRDGAVIGVDERQGPLLSAKFFERLPWGTRLLTNPIGWAAAHGYESQDTVAGPTKLVAWFGPKNANKLYLSFDVIKWPYDPMRSAELVRDAIAARYPGTLQVNQQVDGVLPTRAAADLPTAAFDPGKGRERLQTISLAMADPAAETGRTVKLITVFMNDNGTISRSDVRNIPAGGNQPPRSPAVFAQMGIDNTQLAHRGFIWHRRQSAPEQDLMVDYAWPRRANDPPDEADSVLIDRVYGPEASSAESLADEEFDRAILAHYFPDVSKGKPSHDDPNRFWVLLDRQGNIQATGRAHPLAPALPADFLRDLDLRYPGIRTGEWARSHVRVSSNQSAWVTYVWLAVDSPVVP